MRLSTVSAAALVAVMFLSPALADEAHVGPAKDFVSKNVMPWLNSPEVMEALKAQNARNASLSQADIDALDKQWRAEVDASDKPMIKAVLANDLSQFLAAKKAENAEIITEMFVMDNRGLNVGQSDMSSDYWQGDEGKWQKSFKAGPEAVFVDGIEKDESTQALQSQVSVSIKDDSGVAIGAITVGLNVEKL